MKAVARVAVAEKTKLNWIKGYWRGLICFLAGVAIGMLALRLIKYLWQGNWGNLQLWQVIVSALSAFVVAFLAYMTHRLGRRQVELSDKQDKLLHRQDEMDRNPRIRIHPVEQSYDIRPRIGDNASFLFVLSGVLLLNPGQTPIYVDQIDVRLEGKHRVGASFLTRVASKVTVTEAGNVAS